VRIRRSALPWLVAVVLVAAYLVARSGGGAFPSFDDAHGARVQRVVDGDTVRLVGLGSIRLIGVNTPEVYGQVQCFGPEASAFAKSVLHPGTRVRYQVGREAHDRYGRLLAYVWLEDGRLFNAMLVEGGYAVPLTIAPNDQLAPRFRSEEAEAMSAHAGMWRRRGCAPG
jgi:micrococcal nuclease